MSTVAHDSFGAQPVEVGRAVVEYPFRMNGDRITKTIRRTYKQAPGYFTPTPLGSPDLQFPDAYLIEETDPAPTPTNLDTVTRTYSTVPSTQTVPSSIILSRPALSGTFPQVYGGLRIFQPDTTLLQYDAYAAQTVLSDSGAPSLYPTGGTYTLTLSGSTTGAIAYNASAGTVQTALNAITSVSNRGGVVVTGSYNSANGFTITFNTYATATMDGSLLTASNTINVQSVASNVNGYSQSPAATVLNAGTFTGGTFTLTIFGQTTAAIAYNASAATVQAALNALLEVSNRGNCTVTAYAATILFDARTIAFNFQFANSAFTASTASTTPATVATISQQGVGWGEVQQIYFLSSGVSRTLYVSAHGITVADTIYLRVSSGATYYSAIVGTFTVPDANNIVLSLTSNPSYSAAAAFGEVGKRTKYHYEVGAQPIRCKRITDFYLPGITPGITTADDITLPTNQSDGAALILALLGGSATANVNVGELTQWRGGPILSLTRTTINTADA